jgi:hypothetical protein
MKKIEVSLHSRWSYGFFALALSVLMLWQLLLPGYVILLDWVPGPYLSFSYTDIGSFVQAPSSLLIYGLGFIFSAWVVQKILLVGLVFSLFFIPLVFYPWRRDSFVPYATSLLAVCNSFVYERLLSGQWRVLVGYVSLFPLFYFLFRWSATRSLRSLLGVFGTLLVTGMWSIHFLALGIVVTAIYLVVQAVLLWQERAYVTFFSLVKQLVMGGFIFLVCNLYWIIPYAQSETDVLEHFSHDHFAAFETARDEHIGVVGNVLTMRGFWVERHAWSEQFTLPGSNPWTFYPAILVLLVLVYFGFRALGNSSEELRQRRFMAVVFPLSVIFASGISAVFIWQLNYWLLEHVSFWNGFRETHKWAGVVVVVYALLAGRGLYYLKEHWQVSYRTPLLVGLTIVIAVALAPKLFFGLGGQVSSVWYPESWQAVDSILAESSDCKAVFLPWHQYYAVSWNNGQLSGNPGVGAFDCEVISGQNTELGNMKAIGDHIANYSAIETAVTSNAESSKRVGEAIEALRTSGVKYIITTSDLVGRDIYLYPFLTSPELSRIYEDGEIQLYQVN